MTSHTLSAYVSYTNPFVAQLVFAYSFPNIYFFGLHHSPFHSIELYPTPHSVLQTLRFFTSKICEKILPTAYLRVL